jgi:riboflavin transporter
MFEEKAKLAEKINTQELSGFLILISLATLLPFFIHLQWLTGPLVNATLILILFLTGRKYAFLACFIPSLMALAGGLLPIILLPIIPFIMLSNVIYVFSLEMIYNNLKSNVWGFWVGVFSGSLLKYIFLYLATYLIAQIILKQILPGPILTMMSWPQFITALFGGMIAWIFLRWLKRI